MVSRSMTPALAQGDVSVWEVTWALTVPSPAKVWLTKWKASDVPKMSPPPPLIDQVEPVSVCWPAGRAPPMSEHVQPVGQLKPGGGYSVAVTDTVLKPAVDDAVVVRGDGQAGQEGAAQAGHRLRCEPGTAVHVLPSGEVYAV